MRRFIPILGRAVAQVARGQLQSANRLVATALAETLTALNLGSEDAAAVKLAERYAAALDRAAAVGGQADRVLAAAVRDGDAELVEQVSALRAKLSEQATLDRIGARLTALLVELRATPRARAAARPGPGSSPAGGKLAKMRAARSS